MSNHNVPAPSDDFDENPEIREREAAAERDKIVAEDADRCWHDVKLQPWSEERQRLLDTLTAADIPGPEADVVDDVTFYTGRFSWAVKALYLATHTPKDWEPVRSRLLSVIDAWGCADYIPSDLTKDERQNYVPERLNVPGDNITEKAQAVNFVWHMTEAHKKVMAIRRTNRSGRSASGN